MIGPQRPAKSPIFNILPCSVSTDDQSGREIRRGVMELYSPWALFSLAHTACVQPPSAETRVQCLLQIFTAACPSSAPACLYLSLLVQRLVPGAGPRTPSCPPAWRCSAAKHRATSFQWAIRIRSSSEQITPSSTLVIRHEAPLQNWQVSWPVSACVSLQGLSKLLRISLGINGEMWA